MFLWIFEPHPQWGYMGGGLVIAAGSFEEAQKVINEREEADAKQMTERCHTTWEPNYQTLLKGPTKVGKSHEAYDLWVLVAKATPLEGEFAKPGIVMYNSNCA